MMRNRTPYSSEELVELAIQCDDFCPRRAATFRELIALRNKDMDGKAKDEESSE